MRIQSIYLQNFKRFTDLKIDGVPESAKLVLLIGANGSGKSSVFDALHLFSRRSQEDAAYHRKDAKAPYDLDNALADGSKLHRGSRGWNATQVNRLSFFGRSSLRVLPEVSQIGNPDKLIDEDRDRPFCFTHEDRRFNADLV
jgi:AAA15 family ATPase/GTPase